MKKTKEEIEKEIELIIAISQMYDPTIILNI